MLKSDLESHILVWKILKKKKKKEKSKIKNIELATRKKNWSGWKRIYKQLDEK